MTAPTRTAGGQVFSEGTPLDDADIRQLLRESPLPGGAVSVSLEREPSLAASQELEGGEHRMLVCRAAGGALLAVGGLVARPMLVDGHERRAAYLTQLRLTSRAKGRRALIVEGYARMRTMVDADLVLTSILEDNTPARRLLERGLPGMPEYRLLSAYHTFVLGRGTTDRTDHVRQLGVDDVENVARLLLESGRAFWLAPLWTSAEIARLLRTGTLSMWGVGPTGDPHGCIGVWNLSAGKQAVVRGYSPALRAARSVINLTSGVTGAPRLPRVGEALRMRYLSHAVLERCSIADAQALVGVACAHARREGSSLVAGVAPQHPAHGLLSRHAWSTLRSRIYTVRWAGWPCSLPQLPALAVPGVAGSRINLEVALL